MTSVRLPTDIERRLEVVAQSRHKSKSDIIKEALELFFDASNDEKDSYELGRAFFGLRGSGVTATRNYKQEVKDRIRAKQNSH